MSDVTFWPGDRVRVFDSRLYRDDTRTPLSVTMQAATVLRWYGRVVPASLLANPERFGKVVDRSMIDARFDRDGHESCGHFTDFAEKIDG